MFSKRDICSLIFFLTLNVTVKKKKIQLWAACLIQRRNMDVVYVAITNILLNNEYHSSNQQLLSEMTITAFTSF